MINHALIAQIMSKYCLPVQIHLTQALKPRANHILPFAFLNSTPG